MNKGLVRYIEGWILVIIAVMFMPSCMVALIYGEFKDFFTFLLVAGCCALVGGISSKFKPKNTQMYAREGYIACAITWVLMSIVGCLPFYIGGYIPDFTNALFETVSGFTTTGATIMGDESAIEDLSHSMTFWRCFTNWAGGMGILVFLLAVITPFSGQSNMHLMKAESPGPVVSKFIPKLKNTAVVLYAMYIVLSLIEFVLLLFSGIGVFDSICATFSTAGTGGFSIYNDSIAHYDGNYYAQGVITTFMMLFGVNFTVYFLLIMRKFEQAVKFEELHLYVFIFVAAVVTITVNLYNTGGYFDSLFDCFHHGAFQVATYMSSTGFATQDFDMWPDLSKGVIVFVALIGACAGSTGGGLKVSRILILSKELGKELHTMLHPRSVKVVKMDGKPLKSETVRSVSVYLWLFILIFSFSVLILSHEPEMDFTTNFTAVLATLNNMGPGFAKVGPMANFNSYDYLSKYVLIFDMLAGRLELIPLIIIFAPSCWKSK